MTWRTSNTRSVSISVPESVDPDAIIQVLHNHPRFMQLNPTFIDVTQIQTDPATYEDAWFQVPTGAPIQTYMISSMITILPGVGPRGKKHIQFPTSLRNIDSGVKTKADSPLDITVGSVWTIQPDTTRPQGKGLASTFGIFQAYHDAGWRVVVERTVECAWWLMPFVTRTYDGVNANIGRDLLQLAGSNGR